MHEIMSGLHFAGKNGIDQGEKDEFKATVKTLQTFVKSDLFCGLLGRKGLIQTKPSVLWTINNIYN